ncbi:hypothetical protein AA0119_g2688 [Alternaria tenuissima]|uniref:Prion-inhibition and propagation HeLo domain-containing protein n=1 Tax=Alternaria tenuissima TaxID=119927 RepID=A0AB37WHV9_9PLEO|nr:hypothetical protein AA0115_g6212 [Alternaria tenuissima]RYO06765.1 hypothetical protein AA0119_g2688 [Alternaria tenuissima]RYO18755.1 hypothetical protein AA0121_g4875 [Alternaria tenuissima]
MKAKEEETIITAMQQMSDRLPDLRVYQRIYPEPKLGAMLMDAYMDIILLAREATSYFMSSTWGRQISTIGKPLQFEVMEQSMRKNFSRIRLRCEALLAERVDHLARELKDLTDRLDSNTVFEMAGALQLSDYHTEDAVQSLKQYREVLASVFDNDRHRAKLCLADFLDLDVGRHWQKSDSCLIMLSGRNENGVSSPMSWLSPMAVDMILSLLSEKSRVLFAMCEGSSTLETTLACLTFQLLEQNPKVVRKVEEWYKIKKLISRRGSGRVEALSEALLGIIGLQEQPVFVVIDRPELSEADPASEFAETILRMVEQTDGVLKALIIHRAEFWDWEQNKSLILRKGTPASACQALRLDQRRL